MNAGSECERAVGTPGLCTSVSRLKSGLLGERGRPEQENQIESLSDKLTSRREQYAPSGFDETRYLQGALCAPSGAGALSFLSQRSK